MKKKPIGLIITIALLLSSIGGAIGYNSYIFSQGYDHGSCHDPWEEEGDSIYGADSVTSNGNITITDVDPDIITVGMEFTVKFVVRNMTEVLEYPYGNVNYDVNTVGRDNNTMIGLSSVMADNALFIQDIGDRQNFHSCELNSTGGASETGGKYSRDLEFKLRAPFAGGVYELEIVAVAGVNHSATNVSYVECGFIIALGSVMITVYTSAPVGTLSVASSDDDDDDDDAEGAISGYILIITLAAIFSVSAVLIITMKKRMKNKSRNV